MNSSLQTVRHLYFALLMASAVCTMASYFVIVHYYCCPDHSTRVSPSIVTSVNAGQSFHLVINGTEEASTEEGSDIELQKHLKNCGETAMILKVDLKNLMENNMAWGKTNVVYTLERFPNDNLNRAKAGLGKAKRIESRGYFSSFSYTGDQLSAATRRLFKLNALARYGKRLVVEPLVKDSSFFGDQLSRKRPPLKPLSLYYDMKSANDLLERYGYARFASRQRFLGTCRKKTGTLYVRLLPNAWLRRRIKLNLKVSSAVAASVQKGWIRCALPLPRFQDFALMRELRIVRQICVNTHTVRNFTKLHDEILERYKCVVFHHWSGTGEMKGNYFTSQTTKLPPLQLTHLLLFSSEIVGKARHFVGSALGNKPYISVHIRAERFFRTNPNFTDNFLRFLKCSEFLVKLVDNLKQTWKIQQVFLASDLGERGSKSIAHGMERFFGYEGATAKRLVKNLTDYQNGFIQRLKPVVRAETEKVDKGVEALVDMNILKDGDHLVTVGSGLTWQMWLVDVFKQQQQQKNKKTYSVVKLC